jgi:hypothetical protein
MRKLLHVSLTILFMFAFGLISQDGRIAAATPAASAETQLVYTTPDGFLLGDPVPGASARLVRNDRGITTSVNTSVASGPGVYSLWWLIYNDPASCATYLCTFDLPDLAANAVAHIVRNDGALQLSASLKPGGPYSGEVVLGDPSVGLTNVEGALVFLVVRYHGPAIPGGVQQQLTEYFGGCPDGSACIDEQIVAFPGDCSGACSVPF